MDDVVALAGDDFDGGVSGVGVVDGESAVDGHVEGDGESCIRGKSSVTGDDYLIAGESFADKIAVGIDAWEKSAVGVAILIHER